jgi:phosphatidylglycerol---prolipoprotein diacylglyceryl transferase
MDPVCFYLHNHPVYWYGVFVAAGFLAAVANWNILGKINGWPSEFGSELGFWIMLSGILGARVAYVIANVDVFLAKPIEIIRLDRGGLIFYGGFIGAAVCLPVLARRRKVSTLKLADFTVTGLPLGHALGRIGCFLNGCCYGAVTTAPWGVCAQNAVRHPTPLYESAFNLLVYGLLLWFYPRRQRDGRVLALYLLTYPAGRFLIEFFRGDERLRWLGFNVAQDLSIGLFLVGAIFWWILHARETAGE